MEFFASADIRMPAAQLQRQPRRGRRARAPTPPPECMPWYG